MYGITYVESKLSDEEILRATGLAMCEYLVCGWEGVINDETGEELKFSLENAKSVFMNPEFFGSLNTAIVLFASNYENYLKANLEEDIDTIKK